MKTIFFYIAKIVQIILIKKYWFFVRCRSAFVRADIERLGGTVGKGFLLRPGAKISHSRGSKISIGDNFHMAEGAELFVSSGASLKIGDNVFVGKGSAISSTESVSIGNESQIAHFVTIIDSDHAFAGTQKVLRESGHKSSPIQLGRNNWVGANAVILKGVTSGDGSVVGAGAVLTKSVPSKSVATGNPAQSRAIEA